MSPVGNGFRNRLRYICDMCYDDLKFEKKVPSCPDTCFFVKFNDFDKFCKKNNSFGALDAGQLIGFGVWGAPNSWYLWDIGMI